MKKILLLTDLSDGYGRNLLRGIVRYSKEYGPWVFYRMPLHYRELYGEEAVVRWAHQWKADAIIAQSGNMNIEKLEELKIPIILQNYKERTDKICNITGDYFKTGEMAADFFLNRGFTHFAYYGFKDTIWSRERADGYVSRIKKRGLTVSIRNTDGRKTSMHRPDDPNALIGWLSALPKPSALFACDDYFASQIVETCKMCNISVPDEIAVLGVDNDELLCSISDPPLSSIVLDVEDGGYRAAALLHKLMDKKISRTFDIVIPPVRIESRQSTEKYLIADKQILRIIEYVGKNYAKPISVDDIMRQVPLSRRMLEKRFKKETGISLYQYILRYRVEKLSELLIKTDRSLSESAEACGFDDYKNLARVFRKYKNMTPLQYKNRYGYRLPESDSKR